MRPVNKSLYTINQSIYNPYGTAKGDLIAAIGNFCSYCERQGFYSALDVEHIKHKDSYPLDMFKWDNFLLSCTNCNSCKGTKSVADILLPHCNNTFDVFIYLESGYIQCNPIITDELKSKAQALLNLVRLDRIPNRNGYAGHDKLWQERKQVWELAQRYLIKYQNNTCDIETIKDLALKSGFWSIWMRAFEHFPEVQKELINSFKGTRKEFFEDIINS
ncbi:MAG: HNH endonuclease [Methylococcaceae bacterium]